MELKIVPAKAELFAPHDCQRGRVCQLFTAHSDGHSPSGRYYMVTELDGNVSTNTAGWYFASLSSGYMLPMSSCANYMFREVESHVVIGVKS